MKTVTSTMNHRNGNTNNESLASTENESTHTESQEKLTINIQEHPSNTTNIHSMHTISKSDISKKRVFVATTKPLLSSDIEPTSYTQASKESTWKKVMQEEYDALIKQITWNLTPLPPGKFVIGCKWVYCVKRNLDGSIAHHKSRLVAK